MTVDLHRLDPADLDPRDVAGGIAVYEAARRVDAPHEPCNTVARWSARLRTGWDGDPPTAYLHRDSAGRVDGVLEVVLFKWDNRHLAFLQVTVHPAVRRQGLGRRLYEAGLEIARSASRTTVLIDGWETPHTVAFAESLGLQKASIEVNRRQTLSRVDWQRVDALVKDAAEHAAPYELVQVPDPVPEDLVDRMVTLIGAINDAPTDDLDVEDEVFSRERLRAFERSRLEHGERTYHLVARHRETGEFAGHTFVAVDAERPWYGDQMDTAVLEPHRGHRLGLLLKGSMLHWLADAEPQLLEIDTWNAASNAHMIAVNEALGYEVVGTGVAFQQHL